MKKTSGRILVLAAAILVVTITAVSFLSDLFSPRLITGSGFAMSTFIDQQVYTLSTSRGNETISNAMSTLNAFEERLSMYRTDSDIARINQNAGVASVPVSDDTFALIKKSVAYCAMSDGLFDITIAPVTQAWGISGDNPRVPLQEELDSLKPLVNYQDILLDETTHSVMLRSAGQAIDLGAVAKGEACNLVRELYRQSDLSAGLLSIGGNIMVVGTKPKDTPFVLGIRDPRGAQNEVIGTVRLTDEVLSTSGDYERVFEQDGRKYHHIMDPATASPAETDLMSVTVVCEDGMYADFLSTWLFMLGRDAVLQRIDSFDAGVVAIDKQYQVYVSSSLRDVFTPSQDSTYTYHLD